MNFNFAVSVTVPPQEVETMAASIVSNFMGVRQAAQGAMGECFHEIVRSNFGQFGIDRPIEWAPLSPAYARKVKRDYATLFVTGALEAAVKFDNSDPLQATVSVSDSDVPYATVHQFGSVDGRMPARPYFPVDGAGNVTAFTLGEVTNAALLEIERRLR